MAALVLTAALLLADGGALILRSQAGPLLISVFSSPQPLRVGLADLSVMVQQATDQAAVLDAHVTVHLTQKGPTGIVEVISPAKHENATNKLLYAARMHLPSAGSWRLVIQAESSKGEAQVTGNLKVLGPQPPLLTYWPYFAVIPVIVILFVVNQILKNRRRARA